MLEEDPCRVIGGPVKECDLWPTEGTGILVCGVLLPPVFVLREKGVLGEGELSGIREVPELPLFKLVDRRTGIRLPSSVLSRDAVDPVLLGGLLLLPRPYWGTRPETPGDFRGSRETNPSSL